MFLNLLKGVLSCEVKDRAQNYYAVKGSLGSSRILNAISRY